MNDETKNCPRATTVGAKSKVERVVRVNVFLYERKILRVRCFEIVELKNCPRAENRNMKQA